MRVSFWKSLKAAGRQSVNEVNTIPCNCKSASLNFVEISVDCDSQDTVFMTPFDSHLLCAATGVQTLFVIIRVYHIA